MTTWHSLQLGDALTAQLALAEIQDAFTLLLAASRRPSEMAVFTRHDSEGRLHCEVTAYFSPAAAELARKLGAVACAPPGRRGLDLLAGDPQCWSSLLGEISPVPRPG